MRAAAVQLTATADKAAQPRDGRPARARRPRADGAQLVVLPEKWPVLGGGTTLRDGAEPLDGPAISWARGAARELRIDLVAGSISERVEGEEQLRNTSVHIGPTARSAPCTARSTCSTSRSTGPSTASPSTRSRATSPC